MDELAQQPGTTTAASQENQDFRLSTNQKKLLVSASSHQSMIEQYKRQAAELEKQRQLFLKQRYEIEKQRQERIQPVDVVAASPIDLPSTTTITTSRPEQPPKKEKHDEQPIPDFKTLDEQIKELEDEKEKRKERLEKMRKERSERRQRDEQLRKQQEEQLEREKEEKRVEALKKEQQLKEDMLRKEKEEAEKQRKEEEERLEVERKRVEKEKAYYLEKKRKEEEEEALRIERKRVEEEKRREEMEAQLNQNDDEEQTLDDNDLEDPSSPVDDEPLVVGEEEDVKPPTSDPDDEEEIPPSSKDQDQDIHETQQVLPAGPHTKPVEIEENLQEPKTEELDELHEDNDTQIAPENIKENMMEKEGEENLMEKEGEENLMEKEEKGEEEEEYDFSEDQDIMEENERLNTLKQQSLALEKEEAKEKELQQREKERIEKYKQMEKEMFEKQREEDEKREKLDRLKQLEQQRLQNKQEQTNMPLWERLKIERQKIRDKEEKKLSTHVVKKSSKTIIQKDSPKTILKDEEVQQPDFNEQKLVDEEQPSNVPINENQLSIVHEEPSMSTDNEKQSTVEVDVQQPVAEETQPIVEETQPVVEETQPVEEKEPVVEDKKLDIEEKDSVVEDKDPVVENKDTVAEENQLVEDQIPDVEEKDTVAEKQPVVEDKKPDSEREKIIDDKFDAEMNEQVKIDGDTKIAPMSEIDESIGEAKEEANLNQKQVEIEEEKIQKEEEIVDEMKQPIEAVVIKEKTQLDKDYDKVVDKEDYNDSGDITNFTKEIRVLLAKRQKRVAVAARKEYNRQRRMSLNMRVAQAELANRIGTEAIPKRSSPLTQPSPLLSETTSDENLVVESSDDDQTPLPPSIVDDDDPTPLPPTGDDLDTPVIDEYTVIDQDEGVLPLDEEPKKDDKLIDNVSTDDHHQLDEKVTPSIEDPSIEEQSIEEQSIEEPSIEEQSIEEPSEENDIEPSNESKTVKEDLPNEKTEEKSTINLEEDAQSAEELKEEIKAEDDNIEEEEGIKESIEEETKEETKAETNEVEEIKVEETIEEESKVESKVEEPKIEEPKEEENKDEAPKVEETKVEEPKVEEPKEEKPKEEEPKEEEKKKPVIQVPPKKKVKTFEEIERENNIFQRLKDKDESQFTPEEIREAFDTFDDIKGEYVIDKKSKKRARILNEFLETEEGYVYGLSLLTDVYKKGAEEFLSPDAFRVIFSSVTTILYINKLFLEKMREVMQPRYRVLEDEPIPFMNGEEIKLADILLRDAHSFKLYTEYINSYNDVTKRVKKETKSNTKFRNFLIRTQAVLKLEADNKIAEGASSLRLRNYTLSGLLVTPVQRIPRYRLLLDDLLKTAEPNTDGYEKLEKALEFISTIAAYCNSKRSEMNRQKQMRQLSDQFYADGFTDLLSNPSRKLVIEGECQSCTSSKFPRRVSTKIYLFNDLFVGHLNSPYMGMKFIRLNLTEIRKKEQINFGQIEEDDRFGFQLRLTSTDVTRDQLVVAEFATKREAKVWWDALKETLENK
eukprot:CAMPEP_0117427580 /NCGR_PEP_ID=MMETSP0758-20121206/7406_1 /TAXON_ID=63605 /ORGANISM="Percolomonas cosmopolitus, Strain AE-1 (ATCC 50343)" /LENGTH=1510 /DNA_ID=CAMNT_0005213315 /DNA_START=297 /DNA_END=4830 /DNA_ORIENTATION=-